ncbi:hypothetical protein Ataiwa_06980 [Algoriphagus taiwanensis]|uniref:Uncharacterized protein n=1 Tax=Algoriphagus taiwanensis TaxID=1445656 RepID=A0ABQ6PWU8_9BACT|nr:hypothetical protein Ataiwa_06980 [Algoriphagus taiwanensis]
MKQEAGEYGSMGEDVPQNLGKLNQKVKFSSLKNFHWPNLTSLPPNFLTS